MPFIIIIKRGDCFWGEALTLGKEGNLSRDEVDYISTSVSTLRGQGQQASAFRGRAWLPLIIVWPFFGTL